MPSFLPQKTRSHPTRNPHNPTVAQKTILAGRHRSLARLSCLFPPSTLPCVFAASSTRTSIWEAWISRLEASVLWRVEISRREDSACLCLHALAGRVKRVLGTVTGPRWQGTAVGKGGRRGGGRAGREKGSDEENKNWRAEKWLIGRNVT